jgi:hypothetical protein
MVIPIRVIICALISLKRITFMLCAATLSSVRLAIETLNRLIALPDQQLSSERCGELLQDFFRHLRFLEMHQKPLAEPVTEKFDSEIQSLFEALSLLYVRILEEPDTRLSDVIPDFIEWRQSLQGVRDIVQRVTA